ncbi:2'-5' RNA ligase [Halanaerobium saccharolyticum]|uniref:RNA 2',3'-cyclic phosphodiesterase n=1 Tax=Halanaerobium saccharolyticum TaxID=43595 RepID=A0A4R7Z8G4_9FIRM|nr:RNA 2',3'-cyclic phosphodiesterase [Halanaerobium saccharolyticum]RAK11179.1 2'-5' RNA ligase [Halanaerobium saccharolyticum]TDW07030.1 2'-5' RNA ligase [Halanaerobium saccharolyticum]TDX63795.1 2'-5' RNA ligase [Halanaerobium saccharolyticum]
MRLFIAVNINLRSKDLIERKLNSLKEEYKNQFKWVEKKKWHLTLKFIGEASTKEKEDIIEVLKNINFKEKNEYIQFDRVDAFPHLNQAKVLYLALKQGKDSLCKLHDRLVNELLKYDFEDDQKNYIPHLTLGRNKGEAFKIKEEFQEEHFLNIYAKIESISLYKSELKASGPEYIELFSIK